MTPTIVADPPYLYLFLLVVAIWILSDLSIGWRYRVQPARTQDRGSRTVIGLAVSGGIVGAVLVPWFYDVRAIPLQLLAFWIGLGVMLAGILLRQYAVAILGEYFSLEVAVDQDDRVVQTGPYRWVRHPSYTGALLTMIGAGLALGTWASLCILVVAGVIGYGYRIRIEEAALHEHLGEEYARYADETAYRLVPLLW